MLASSNSRITCRDGMTYETILWLPSDKNILLLRIKKSDFEQDTNVKWSDRRKTLYSNSIHVGGLYWKRAGSEKKYGCLLTFPTAVSVDELEPTVEKMFPVFDPVLSPREPLLRWVTRRLWPVWTPSSCPDQKGGPAGWLAATAPHLQVWVKTKSSGQYQRPLLNYKYKYLPVFSF